MLNLRHVAIVSFAVGIVGIAGCAANDDVDVDDPSTEVDPQGSSTSSSSGGTGSVTCPMHGVDAKPYQQKATELFGYIIGSSVDPFRTANTQNANCRQGISCVKYIRDAITGKSTDSCSITSPKGVTTVCGLKAAEYELKCATATVSQIAQCSVYLDSCWAVGVSGFFTTGLGSDSRTIKVDPETAITSQPLSGNNGATAAATILDTTPVKTTKVVKWAGTDYTAPIGVLNANDFCSLDNMTTSQATLKRLGVRSGKYKCL